MDISRQSSILNDGLVENRVGEIDKEKRDEINKFQADLTEALRIQNLIVDLFIEENASFNMARNVCISLAECMHHFMMFGGEEK